MQTVTVEFTSSIEGTAIVSSDYSIAAIGRLSSEQGGPSAAAIRNKPGEDYQIALIKTYAEFVRWAFKKNYNKLKMMR